MYHGHYETIIANLSQYVFNNYIDTVLFDSVVREFYFIDNDNIRYVNAGRLRRVEGLVIYYPLGLSVPNGWASRY